MTTAALVADPLAHLQVDEKNARKAAYAGGIGTLIEWFDYGLFGTASALYLGPLFFSGDTFAATLSAFATFAVGFAIRPIGGIVLGNLGDVWGRKRVLILTIILMGSATFLMGTLPTIGQVGVLAPILLVFLRLLQGFGAGAEFAGSLTYVAESSNSHNRGFHLSFTSAASAGGTFIGAGLFAIMNGSIPADQMQAWGWRVPFLASGIFVIIGLLVRRRIQDSDDFRAYQARVEANQVKPPKVPLAEVYRHDPRAFWSALLAPSAIGFTSYGVSVFGTSYIVNTLGLPPQLSLITLLCLTGIGTVTCILFGRLADRVGAVRLMIAAALLGISFAVPFFLLLNTKIPFLVVLGGVLGYVIMWSIIAPAQGLLLPKLFDVQYRYSGLALTREICSALTAGPAPLIGAALVGAMGGQPWLMVVAISVALLLSAAGAALGSHRST